MDHISGTQCNCHSVVAQRKYELESKENFIKPREDRAKGGQNGDLASSSVDRDECQRRFFDSIKYASSRASSHSELGGFHK